MTLSNEQRAHDLAIASLPIKYDIKKTQLLAIANSQSKAGNDITIDISFDSYLEYEALYKTLLSIINSK